MPTTSHPPTPTTPHRNMPRLPRAARTLKIFTTLVLLIFAGAYARTALRYATPHPQTSASLAKPSPETFFTPTHSPARPAHRRHTFFRPAHQVKRHTRRSSPFYLASLRRLRRLVSQLLVVRS